MEDLFLCQGISFGSKDTMSLSKCQALKLVKPCSQPIRNPSFAIFHDLDVLAVTGHQAAVNYADLCPLVLGQSGPIFLFLAQLLHFVTEHGLCRFMLNTEVNSTPVFAKQTCSVDFQCFSSGRCHCNIAACNLISPATLLSVGKKQRVDDERSLLGTKNVFHAQESQSGCFTQ